MRKTMLAVCGLAPQVITEAIYALFGEGRAVDTLEVITTRRGKDLLLSRLLPSEDGKFNELLADFDLPATAVDFSPRHIHGLRHPDGREIDDIVSPEDNEILLQTCLDRAFALTAEADRAVYFLVAGGRKTMTSCLTLAAQLYGRPQDRILHVLVSPEFENCPEFWFPPRHPQTVQLRDELGQPYWKQTTCARIDLITIPFVSVRDRLAPELLDRPHAPAELMQSLIRDQPRTLTVNLTEGKLSYGPAELDLLPAWLALYAFFANRKKECRLRRSCQGCTECYLSAADLVQDEGVGAMYQKIIGLQPLREFSDSGITSLSKANFQSYKSKIRQALIRAFGQSHAADLEITAAGTRPESRYGLRIDRQRIRMEW